jgi:hypothetical protein
MGCILMGRQALVRIMNDLQIREALGRRLQVVNGQYRHAVGRFCGELRHAAHTGKIVREISSEELYPICRQAVVLAIPGLESLLGDADQLTVLIEQVRVSAMPRNMMLRRDRIVLRHEPDQRGGTLILFGYCKWRLEPNGTNPALVMAIRDISIRTRVEVDRFVLAIRREIDHPSIDAGLLPYGNKVTV